MSGIIDGAVHNLIARWIGGIKVEVEYLGNERHATAVKHLDIREILATKTMREIALT